MIVLEKILHKGKSQIALRFEYDLAIKSKIKTLKDIKYSKTLKCWYINNNWESFEAFKALGIEYKRSNNSGTTDVPSSKSVHTAISLSKGEKPVFPSKQGTKKDADIRLLKSENIEIVWNRDFQIKMPYDSNEVKFIKSLTKAWWNSKYNVWLVAGTISNLEKLQNRYNHFSKDNYLKLFDLILAQTSPRIIEIYRTPEYKKSIMIKIRGFEADYEYIKTITGRKYHKDFKRWEVPYDLTIIKKLLKYYSDNEYKIINRLPKKSNIYKQKMPNTSNRTKYLLNKLDKKYHESIMMTIDTLVRQKYSWSTVKQYTGKLIRLMEFTNKFNMDEISSEEVNNYMARMASDDVSDSQLNMVFSAVKFYFTKVKFVKDFDIDMIKRPRKGRYLPAILSIQEVDRILRAVDNLKHVSILYVMYGSGLRLGEVLGLRVENIYWDRNQILVEGGKGRKDRMVMLPITLKNLLAKYFDQYQPEYWLFEGADRQKQYSSSSINKIVKQSVKKVGISRRVTPHTFRHCFSTHLMDNGLDVRFIQELLGHKDIKTTMIYTHVTNRHIGQIRSPLDNL